MDHSAIVKLGRTGLNVTALGFGATAIGGMYEEVSGAQASAVVDAAWDQGIRYYDAAPQYGLGLGETRLGLPAKILCPVVMPGTALILSRNSADQCASSPGSARSTTCYGRPRSKSHRCSR